MNIFKRIWTWFLPELTPQQSQAAQDQKDFNRGALDCECGHAIKSGQSVWYVDGYRQKEYRMDRESRLDAWKRRQ